MAWFTQKTSSRGSTTGKPRVPVPKPNQPHRKKKGKGSYRRKDKRDNDFSEQQNGNHWHGGPKAWRHKAFRKFRGAAHQWLSLTA